MRYLGQSWELIVDLPGARTPADATAAFNDVHDKRFGHRSGGSVEIVNFRVAAIGRVKKPKMRSLASSVRRADAQAGTREVYLAGAFRSAIESAGLRFDVECAPMSEPVHVDRSMWEKVVFNLLSNALKFTLEGGVSLRIRSAAGGRIAFEVTDTGIGIPSDKRELVFEAFRQVDSGANRRFGGTGLGLSISRELARLLGGDIRVSAGHEGQGTIFTLVLPVEAASQAAA